MISNAFVNLGFAIINGIVTHLPDSSGFTTAVISAISTLGTYFGIFSPIIPLSTLLLAVTLCFSTEIAVFAWKTIKSIVSHIPWFGGAGH